MEQEPQAQEQPKDQPTPEQPKATPTQPPKTEMPPIVIQNTAKIEWLDMDADGAEKVIAEESCFRNIVTLMQFLGKKLKEDNTLASKKLRVSVHPEKDQPKKEDGSDYVFILAEGTLEEALTQLMKKAIPPQLAIREFQSLSAFMSDRTSLKAVMVTMVFGDAEAAGFGFLTTTAEVTDTDIITLASAANNQVKLFKEEVKKKHPDLKFPDDEEKSKIILPGQFGRYDRRR